ncbi:hypothetical protein BD408DRAFT_269588 [Parasitella parasitica]|nr:hypothetical protein BD408DRAFT_269588 [Parasitella parasitica]
MRQDHEAGLHCVLICVIDIDNVNLATALHKIVGKSGNRNNIYLYVMPSMKNYNRNTKTIK